MMQYKKRREIIAKIQKMDEELQELAEAHFPLTGTPAERSIRMLLLNASDELDDAAYALVETLPQSEQHTHAITAAPVVSAQDDGGPDECVLCGGRFTSTEAGRKHPVCNTCMKVGMEHGL